MLLAIPPVRAWSCGCWFAMWDDGLCDVEEVDSIFPGFHIELDDGLVTADGSVCVWIVGLTPLYGSATLKFIPTDDDISVVQDFDT